MELLSVAMATIEDWGSGGLHIQFIVWSHFLPVTNIFDSCHGNIIMMLPWQPYKG